MTHKESSASISSSMTTKKETHSVSSSSSSFAASSVQQMRSSVMEASSFSSMAAEMKFETMSMSSMSSAASESYAVSSSSLGLTSSRLEGSSFRAIGKRGDALVLRLQERPADSECAAPPGSAPRIEALPEDISIEPGKVLTVACAFSGEAQHIQWSRGGRSIETTAGGRFHVETTEDLTTLIITQVREEDAGTYTLKLSNELGSDSAIVHISIRSV